jgi:hypothetical protein
MAMYDSRTVLAFNVNGGRTDYRNAVFVSSADRKKSQQG